MERLTNKREADAQRVEYERRLANGYPRNVPEERFLRLAAYEDTGLMPEEVAEYKKFEDEAVSKGVSFARIVELLEADKDGRVAVLPCKVGDSVFLIDCENGCCHECEVDFVNIGRPFKTVVVRSKSNGEQYGAFSGALGKTVFLSREATEAALKEARP